MDCPTHKGHQLTEVLKTCSECGSPHGVSHYFCIVDGQQYDIEGNPVLVETAAEAVHDVDMKPAGAVTEKKKSKR